MTSDMGPMTCDMRHVTRVKGLTLSQNTVTGATPREKSWEKGHRQKVNFLCFNMKDNQSTGQKSNILSYIFLSFLGPFWPFWVWTKKCLIFDNLISKKAFRTVKTKFDISN